MSTLTPEETAPVDTGETFDPFALNIEFIENTPAADTVLMCSTGDNCGTSCPSACTTS
ncbi:FxLD family lanthipeptide [Streptosporangium lutulentum]|uniref:FxLD family lantipeptide n=1 Tax=Streptosporangium lutulentum TaxID=1461250 RepID=A0ABT9QMZ6_9ACTN|nr:FxLD family lanthipeptide [Streptosporangium lutulentum]MDP9848114.1 FxLD family lantipeptide [Streptosporangium lutulentum]